MSKLEICFIVVTCLIPVLAVLLILPKRKAKKPIEKKTEKPTEKQDNTQQKTPIQNSVQTANLEPFKLKDQDPYKDYIINKAKSTTKPIPKNSTYRPSFMPFDDGFDLPARQNSANKEQSLEEEINNLSPELKVILFTGVLDKKDWK